MENLILRQCARENLPLPDRIANAPELLFGLQLFYQAFVDLHTSRSGMGDGPIPWLAIEQYCRINEFDEDQSLLCHTLVRKVDSGYLEWKDAKGSKQIKNKSNYSG